jgi:Fic family protein
MEDKIINSLFGSKLKARILKLFLHNPDSSFNLANVSEKIKMPKNSIKKEITSLCQLGILKRINEKQSQKKNKPRSRISK